MSVAEDLRFEKRWFRFEHATWLVLGALLASACLGVSGPGLLSRRTAEKDSLRVQYSAVIHEGAPSELELEFAPEATEGGRVAIEVTGPASNLQASPSPALQEAHERGTRLDFQVAPGKRAHVKLMYAAEQPGTLRRRITLEHGAAVRLTQFVLP